MQSFSSCSGVKLRRLKTDEERGSWWCSCMRESDHWPGGERDWRLLLPFRSLHLHLVLCQMFSSLIRFSFLFPSFREKNVKNEQTLKGEWMNKKGVGCFSLFFSDELLLIFPSFFLAFSCFFLQFVCANSQTFFAKFVCLGEKTKRYSFDLPPWMGMMIRKKETQNKSNFFIFTFKGERDGERYPRDNISLIRISFNKSLGDLISDLFYWSHLGVWQSRKALSLSISRRVKEWVECDKNVWFSSSSLFDNICYIWWFKCTCTCVNICSRCI